MLVHVELFFEVLLHFLAVFVKVAANPVRAKVFTAAIRVRARAKVVAFPVRVKVPTAAVRE